MVFISDSEISLKRVKSLEIETWKCSNPAVSWSLISDNWSFSRKFRDDFWFKTLARFYSLHEFMQSHSGVSVLHIESDVLLLKNFPFEIFENLGNCISYPLKSDHEGIASLLYISDSLIAQKLISYIEDCSKVKESITDVSILGSFFKDYAELYFPMPSALPVSIDNDQNDSNIEVDLSRNLEFFGGIFDASSIGIYFTGEDPRNANGFIRLFSPLDHPIPVHDYIFNFTDSILSATYKKTTANVFSLHIHSKDLRLFNIDKSSLRLEYLTKNHLLGEKLESQGFRTLKIKVWDLIAKTYVKFKLKSF